MSIQILQAYRTVCVREPSIIIKLIFFLKEEHNQQP